MHAVAGQHQGGRRSHDYLRREVTITGPGLRVRPVRLFDRAQHRSSSASEMLTDATINMRRIYKVAQSVITCENMFASELRSIAKQI